MTAIAVLSPENAERACEVIENMIYALAGRAHAPVEMRTRVYVGGDRIIHVDWELETRLEPGTAGEVLRELQDFAGELRRLGVDVLARADGDRVSLRIGARLPARPAVPVVAVYDVLLFAPLYLVAYEHVMRQVQRQEREQQQP